MPARSTWFTGLPPNRNGATCNDTAPSRAAHHVGKRHLDAAGYAGTGRADGGFDETSWYDLARFYADVGRAGINRFGGWMRGLQQAEYCFAHRVIDRAIDVLRTAAHGAAPMFLAVELDEPHGPYICPPPFQGRYEQRRLPRPPSFPVAPEGKPRLQREYSAWLAADRTSPTEYPRYYHK